MQQDHIKENPAQATKVCQTPSQQKKVVHTCHLRNSEKLKTGGWLGRKQNPISKITKAKGLVAWLRQ
jgi:hypothetical protein